jgi:hypothetical protein
MTEKYKYRERDRQTDRETDVPIDNQTNGQIDI